MRARMRVATALPDPPRDPNSPLRARVHVSRSHRPFPSGKASTPTAARPLRDGPGKSSPSYLTPPSSHHTFRDCTKQSIIAATTVAACRPRSPYRPGAAIAASTDADHAAAPSAGRRMVSFNHPSPPNAGRHPLLPQPPPAGRFDRPPFEDHRSRLDQSATRHATTRPRNPPLPARRLSRT